MTKIYSATIFFPAGSFRPRKYRNIYNKLSFIKFAKQSGGIYINFYDKETKDFLFQHKIV
jgi:hypothetical protein